MTGFPEILLPEVLDYLDLHELLFSAMPVSQFWRSSAIEHPRYWKFISLDEESTHERRVHSADLFFLRLARAGTKPVDLRIWMKDPTAVLDTLTREIYHIRRLTMCTEVTHSDLPFQCMRDTPAPILKSFSLTLTDETSSHKPGMVPNVLFADHSPVLTDVNITNVDFPSGAELPTWLANAPVTMFIYSSCLLRPQSQHLPNIFTSWPRLKTLILSGIIELNHPAFLQPGTWAGLEQLSLGCGLVRRIPALPLAHIPLLRISNTSDLSADETVFITNSLMKPGPLEITISTDQYHHPDPTVVFSTQLNVELRCLPDAGKKRGRWIRGYLPHDAPGSHPYDMVTAFQRAPLLARIVSLCISLDSWDTLVGRGYLVHFSAVEDLGLTLELWFRMWNEAWHPPTRAAKLDLPRLRRIVFRYEHYRLAYRKPVLQLADLAEYITNQLSGVRLPLHLSIEGATSAGVPEEFTHVLKL